MDRLNFLTTRYCEENQRQAALNNSLSIPIGILTGLFAITFFMFNSFSYSTESSLFLKYLFSFLLFSSFCSSIIVIYYLFKSYNNLFKSYEYKELPFPKQLNDHYKELENYVIEYKNELEPDQNADSLYAQQFQEILINCLDRSIRNNDTKNKFLFLSRKFLLINIILVILTSVPFSIHFVKHKANNNFANVTVLKHNVPNIISNALTLNPSKIDKNERK
ncbi:MAG: hypothetical protein J0H55_06655 [Chitinophagaceae bacterium]|nr:hypothetical protein [Chitinophagaceae bacterium]